MRNKWTLEKLQEEANKYSTRSEFRENSKGAYLKANKLKITDKLFENHSNNGYKIEFWTDEKIICEIKKCKNRKEFWDNNKLFNAAYRHNININSMFDNDTDGYSKKPNGYWTNEKLQEDVNKYKSRNIFYLKNPSAYKIACDLNILDDLFKNCPNKGYSKKCNWIHNNYVIYSYEIKKHNIVYIGLTNNIIRRDKEHLFGDDSLITFCNFNNIKLPKYKILEQNLSSNDAKNKELDWINFYKINEWKLLNIAKGGSLGGFPKKWNYKKLQTLANKYKSRKDFKINNLKAYNVAYKLKIMDKIFENHPNKGYSNKQQKLGYWTYNKLQEIANSCKYRIDFENISGASNAARRLNIYNKLFENHPNKGYKKRKL